MKLVLALTLALAPALLAMPVSAQNPCIGQPDSTAALQAAVSTQAVVNLSPAGGPICVNARTGIRVPSNVRINFNGALVGMLPGCTVSCKTFETVPGATGVVWQGPGTLEGDLTPAPGFQTLLRCDSAQCEIHDLTLRNVRWDGIYLGGNLGYSDTVVDRVLVENFGRNGMSVVNGVGARITRSVFRLANPSPIVGAGVLVEGNPGDRNRNVIISDNLAEDVLVGFYVHAGKGEQGFGITLQNNEVRRASTHSYIVNGMKHVSVRDNIAMVPPPVPGKPVPIGFSIGVTIRAGQPASAAVLTEDATVEGNTVFDSTRPMILAGVVNSIIGPNVLGTSGIAQPSPGLGIPPTAGLMIFRPATPDLIDPHVGVVGVVPVGIGGEGYMRHTTPYP